MKTDIQKTGALPASLRLHDISIDQALAALAAQLADLAAARVFAASDIECSLNCDITSGRASLHFRCCR